MVTPSSYPCAKLVTVIIIQQRLLRDNTVNNRMFTAVYKALLGIPVTIRLDLVGLG